MRKRHEWGASGGTQGIGSLHAKGNTGDTGADGKKKKDQEYFGGDSTVFLPKDD